MEKLIKHNWTEKEIQKKLILEFNGRRKHKLCVPNIFLYDWESDLISITQSDSVFEFEIKCSKWDYLNDFKKVEKHESFKRLNGKFGIPNYFYYACPPELTDNILESLPEYAGLVQIENYGAFVIKKSPELHKEKFDKWEQLAIKQFYKTI